MRIVSEEEKKPTVDRDNAHSVLYYSDETMVTNSGGSFSNVLYVLAN